MNRSEILAQVYDAILHRPVNTGQRWYLCWADGRIRCLPMSHQPKPDVVFDTRTTYQLSQGCTENEWWKLELKIYTFLKDKGLCNIQ